MANRLFLVPIYDITRHKESTSTYRQAHVARLPTFVLEVFANPMEKSF
jgi:hypothetical protein